MSPYGVFGLVVQGLGLLKKSECAALMSLREVLALDQSRKTRCMNRLSLSKNLSLEAFISFKIVVARGVHISQKSLRSKCSFGTGSGGNSTEGNTSPY